jgi:hypothetical protein
VVRARHWFGLSVLVYPALLGWAWTVLPEGPVPLHFGADGTPDRFGGRNEALLGLAVVGSGAAALMGGCGHLVGSGRLSFRHVNVPHKEYWSRPDHQDRARAMLREDNDLFAALTMGLLCAVVVMVVDSALHPGSRAGWFWLVVAAYLVLVGVWATRMYTHRYRPPEEI